MKWKVAFLAATVAGATLVLYGADEDAPSEQPKARAGYMGNQLCTACHAELTEKFKETTMGKHFEDGRMDCELCHGPGSLHVQGGGGKGVGGLVNFGKTAATPPAEQSEVCLSCHETQHTDWKTGPHAGGELSCAFCHQVMEETGHDNQLRGDIRKLCSECHPGQAAKTARYSHMPLVEGRMACADCHDPHGSQSQFQLKEWDVNETCNSCHAEKRGPFLFEHAPVAESCTNCHEPHGSSNPSLLVARPPFLCQTCHERSGHVSSLYDSSAVGGARELVNKGCVNCHSAIHGSNHPSGVFLQR